MSGGLSNSVQIESGRTNPLMTLKPDHGYLQFRYYNPISKKDEEFPAGTPINIIYVDKAKKETRHSSNPLKLDSDGKIDFPIEQKTNLYFEIEFKELTFLNITKKSLIPQSDFAKQVQDKRYEPDKDMIFMLLPKMTLANSLWKVDNVPVYDGNNYIFKDLMNNTLSSGSGYLKVVLNPEWQYIAFRYYNRDKRDWEYVPPNFGLFGYDLDVSETIPITISNVQKSKIICLPWIARKKRDPKKIVLGFSAPNYFVKSDGTLVTDTITNVRSKPLMERFKYYDLPEYWRSNNWKASLGPHGKLVPIENLMDQKTSESTPIVFDLDSIVLTDSNLKCESWNKDDRFTVFNIYMEVANPDTNKPYWTKGKLDTNFFSRDVKGDFVRVIAVNGVFYDVTDKRSKSEPVIGARAAVRNDPNVHCGQNCVEPIQGVGNFELHYFKDCLDYSVQQGTRQENPIDVLMVYWSCKFTGKGNDIANFQKEGLLNAKTRWELKNYRFTPRGSSNVSVKPVFFFEGREKQPFKCTVNISNFVKRPYMGVNVAELKPDNYKQSWETGTDADGREYKKLMIAHEIGHAMGLDDEYLEHIEPPHGVLDELVADPNLPRFFPDQYYPGMPYSCDPVTIMAGRAQSPRLRHLWYFCRKLNETEEIKKFTGNSAFQINYNAGNRSYNYYLEEQFKEFRKPAYSQENVRNGASGIFDLFLYKLGNDETCDIIVPGERNIDSILVIRHKILWKFIGDWPDNFSRISIIGIFQSDIDNAFKLRRPRERLSDSDFRRVYFYFVPHHHFGSTTAPAHFEITVLWSGNLNADPEFYADNFNSNQFNVLKDALRSISIYRYMLGLTPYRVESTNEGPKKMSIDNIDDNELTFLLNWITNQR